MEEIRVITKGADLLKIGPKTFKDFITPFVKERAQLSILKAPTLAQELAWLKMQAAGLDKNQQFFVLLFINSKLAGNCDIRRKEPQAQSSNVHFGLAVSKPYRGMGWGEKLLRIAIAEAKKRFKPHRMWIEYCEGNAPARRLYQKVGFVEFARLDEYVDYFGQWRDSVLMQYKPARKTNSSRKR